MLLDIIRPIVAYYLRHWSGPLIEKPKEYTKDRKTLRRTGYIIVAFLIAVSLLALSFYNVWQFSQGSGYRWKDEPLWETWFDLIVDPYLGGYPAVKEGWHHMIVLTTITFQTMTVATKCAFWEVTWTGDVVVERYLYARSLVVTALILLGLALIFEVWERFVNRWTPEMEEYARRTRYGDLP